MNVSRETISLDRRLLAAYPVLSSLPENQLAQDLNLLRASAFPPASVLFAEGADCLGFPFVLDGEIRVVRTARDGKELELYRVGPGDICIASAAASFGSGIMSARGISLNKVALLMVSESMLMRWTRSEAVRRFVLGVFADRLTELTELVESLAFQPLQARLANALLGHGHALRTTHQELANELGTTREHVSRMLKRFERSGALRLHREHIEILDPSGLRLIADSH